MVAAGREPLLLVALVARLEVLPLLQRGGLDPGRAETRADGQVDQAGQAAEFRGGRARPHPGQFGPGRRPVPESLGEQHPAARRDQPPELGQRGRGVPGGLDPGERVTGPQAQHQVGGPAAGPDPGLLDERGTISEPPGPGVVPAPGQVALVRVEADPGRVRRRREDAEHQLTPPAADVEHGPGTVPGEPGDEPGRPGLGQGTVERQPGQSRRELSVSHMRRRLARHARAVHRISAGTLAVQGFPGSPAPEPG